MSNISDIFEVYKSENEENHTKGNSKFVALQQENQFTELKAKKTYFQWKTVDKRVQKVEGEEVEVVEDDVQASNYDLTKKELTRTQAATQTSVKIIKLSIRMTFNLLTGSTIKSSYSPAACGCPEKIFQVSTCYDLENFELKYFATSHGKGPVNGLHGGLKCLVRRRILSRKVVVSNAIEFAQECKTSTAKVIVITPSKIAKKAHFSTAVLDEGL
ncbi:unnamed protein product [Lepeophtheirus salmonis]|uniref:(salmon louse) hypothetical protein n=1 Tax=Lepeophtheirus salmonis TaxID=72036 RepID=A0A7R8CJC4_LEPSM|nr:unnamed protein product [Lepeophtheirus salmonis]CAF2840600.1 unnamed protein product [Lepeophtheirus salmonis]